MPRNCQHHRQWELMTMNSTGVECIILVPGHLCITHEWKGTRSVILATEQTVEERCTIEQSPSFLVDSYVKQRNAFHGWQGGTSPSGCQFGGTPVNHTWARCTAFQPADKNPVLGTSYDGSCGRMTVSSHHPPQCIKSWQGQQWFSGQNYS